MMTLTNFEHGKWSVDCIDCKENIGTMNWDILRKAMEWARDKGGIKCVPCRKSSCEGCGFKLCDEKKDEVGRLCIFCELEAV